jgi:hypothetical protein
MSPFTAISSKSPAPAKAISFSIFLVAVLNMKIVPSSSWIQAKL